MRWFLIGLISNIAIVFLGYLLIGFLGATFIRATDSPHVGTEEFNFWNNVVTSLGMLLLALLATLLHTRLTPRSLLGPLPAGGIAVAVALAVVTALTIPFMLEQNLPEHVAMLLGLTTAGAILGAGIATLLRRRAERQP